MKQSSPDGSSAFGAFYRLRYPVLLSLLLTSLPAQAGFFLTRNQNPLTLFQGQPLPLPAESLPSKSGWEFSTDISNSLNVDSSLNQNLYVDFESYYLNLRLIQALSTDWTLIIDVPVVRRSGGHLDNLIDNWHEFFGLPRANRPAVADDQFLISYDIGGNSILNLNTAETGIGDISMQLGFDLYMNGKTRARLWMGLELPTGDRSSLTGNDGLDANITLAIQHGSPDSVSLDLNVGLVAPGETLFQQNATRDSVLYAYAAASWSVLDWMTLRLQLENTRSYFEQDELDFLSGSTIIVFGGSLNFDDCNRLDIGVSEDIRVGTSPDVSFLLNWTNSFCR